MQARLRFLLLLPVLALIACGGNSTPVTGTSYTPVSGDYVITAGVGTASAANFVGDLLVNQPTLCNGATVCGVFNYVNSCAASTPAIAFSGSYQSNVLTLTSASFSGSVATLTIKLPFADNNLQQQVASGTSVIAGGTCAVASSPLQAQLVPSLSGTYTAALTSPSITTASIQVAESSTANGTGAFPTTGTLTFPTCGAGTPDSTFSGTIAGNKLQLTSSTSGATVTADFSISPATVAINASCGFYNGTLTH